MMNQLELMTLDRHREEMRRDVNQARLANAVARNAVARNAGEESLLSRMVKLLPGFGRQSQAVASPEARLTKQRLASAKLS